MKKKKQVRVKKKKIRWRAGLGPWAVVFRPVSDPKLGPCPCQAHSGCQVHVQTNELQCQNKGSRRRKPKVPGLCSCIVGARGAAGGAAECQAQPPGRPSRPQLRLSRSPAWWIAWPKCPLSAPPVTWCLRPTPPPRRATPTSRPSVTRRKKA